MSKNVIYTTEAPKPRNRLSQAIRVGNLVYTAGIVGTDPATGQVAADDVKSQTRQTLENIKAILKAGGTSLDNVFKVNAYLRDVGDFPAFNEIYNQYFGPEEPPARTALQVGRFPGDIAVEIEVIAFIEAE